MFSPQEYVDVVASIELAEMLAGRRRKRAHEREWQGKLLVGIIGNDNAIVAPLRNDTTIPIAREMYDTRDFGAMPILADALEDAGYQSVEWLTRMRDPTWPWCRGCRILDLLLDK